MIIFTMDKTPIVYGLTAVVAVPRCSTENI